MQKLLSKLQMETIKGWEIEQSEDGYQNINISEKVLTQEPVSRTQVSDERRVVVNKKLTPMRSPNKTPNRTPLPSFHDSSNLSRAQGKKKVNYTPKMPPVQQPLSMVKLRLRMNAACSPQAPKPYSQNQLQAILQLKRKNLYLQSILRKVQKGSDDRYSRSQFSSHDLFLGINNNNINISNNNNNNNNINSSTKLLSPCKSIHLCNSSAGTQGQSGFYYKKKHLYMV